MESNKEFEKDLTCTMCKEVQETYSEIVYSQGSRVCLDCKKITQKSDNMAFDRYIHEHKHLLEGGV